MEEVILPLLRYSNSPKVRGCRVQFFKSTASMDNFQLVTLPAK